MPATNFRIFQDETVCIRIVGERFDRVSGIVRDVNRMYRDILRNCVSRHVCLIVSVHVIQFVIGRNHDIARGRAAYNIRIDIKIARRDENIAVRLDAGADGRYLRAVRRDRIAADTRDAAVSRRVVRLDVIAVLHIDVHGACINRARIFYIAVIARHRDGAVRIVNISGERYIGGHIHRRAVYKMCTRVEGIGNYHLGRLFRFRRANFRKADGFRRIFIERLDLIGHSLSRRLQMLAVEIHAAALVRAARAAAPDNGNISDLEMIRRIIRHRDGRIPLGIQSPRPVDIIAFKKNIAHDRRHIVDDNIVNHLFVDVFV